jgi:hypothetical protein
MAASTTVTSSDIHTIQNTSINVAPGVTLTDLQKKHVGVVLDLFQAKGELGRRIQANPRPD